MHLNESQANTLKRHIDLYCGKEPDKIYKIPNESIVVVMFHNVPDEGLSTFISVGLSGHLMKQVSGKSIRQELLMTVDNYYRYLPIEQIIFTTAKLMIETHSPVMNGEVIGPSKLLFPESRNSRLTDLLCSYPAYFDEKFSFFENEDTTVMVELIPLLPCEAKNIGLEGYSDFFQKLDDGSIDGLNYFR